MSSTEQLVNWLNSAHAMEESLVQVLSNHATDAKDFPDIRTRLEQHVEETKSHVVLVERALEILGEKPSKVKSLIGNVTGMVQGASTGMYRDELVKNFLADFASENFEIACYRSLIAAAEELGQTEIAEIAQDILDEEEVMAEWVHEMIPVITRTYLQDQAAHA